MADQLTGAQQKALREEEQKSQTNAPLPDVGASPAEAFISGFQQKTIQLPQSDLAVTIQRLGAAEYLNVYSSPVPAMMTAAGLDYNDAKARETFFDNGGVPKEVNYNEVLRHYRRIVIKAVTSIRLSLQPQHLCNPGEVSIEQISDLHILFIVEEVNKLSGWDADVDRFQRTIPKSKEQ